MFFFSLDKIPIKLRDLAAQAQVRPPTSPSLRMSNWHGHRMLAVVHRHAGAVVALPGACPGGPVAGGGAAGMSPLASLATVATEVRSGRWQAMGMWARIYLRPTIFSSATICRVLHRYPSKAFFESWREKFR